MALNETRIDVLRGARKGHAQAKPPIFVITEIDISDPEGYGNEFVPKLKPSKHLAPSS